MNGHVVAFEAAHPLGPAVGDRFGAFDGVDEVFAEAFLDDFFFAGAGAGCGTGIAPPNAAAVHRSRGRFAGAIGRTRSSPSSSTSLIGNLRQLGDLLDEVDRADDQPDLGVFVFFAAVVGDADEAFDVQLAFVLVGDRDVVGGPGDAAGEIRDLDRGFAVESRS